VKETTVKDKQPIEEIQVIMGVAKWLRSQGWTADTVSVPHGQGLDTRTHRNQIKSVFPEVRFSNKGPDIIAHRGDELWRIECKSLGNVPRGTLKNQFDRAVASAVSYYDRKGIQVGLALPEAYRQYIVQKLPRALREAINLWILLYVVDEEIYPWGPDEDMEI
jgi:hypothetical protein